MSVPVRPVRMNAEQKRADSGGEAQVGRAREAQATAEGDAVDRADDDLRRLRMCTVRLAMNS